MKYIITKTDLFINGTLVNEGAVIDSSDYSEEDIESVLHLLVPVDRKSEMAITLDQIASIKTSQVAEDGTKSKKHKHKTKNRNKHNSQ